MNALPFIAFALVFVALVCAHFIPAYRAWRASRGELLSDIDPDYVRIEDYFARSFRLKVSEWLKLPSRQSMPDGTRTIDKGEEIIRVIGPSEYPARSQSDEVLVVQGAFRCGDGCVFHREILVRQDAVVGSGSRLQALAADGNVTLEAGVHVTRWVDSARELEIGPGTIVLSRATAGRLIRLESGSKVASAFAPAVTSPHVRAEGADESTAQQLPEHEIPCSVEEGDRSAGRIAAGIDPVRLHRLSTDTWLYDGNLEPASPVLVTKKLIVRGDCTLASGSVLECDLKASGRIDVGEHSRCHGNLIAGRDIVVGQAVRFSGVVHAGRCLRLSRGVRGGDAGTKVAAYAGESLLLEDDVLIHGKLASGGRVEVLSGLRPEPARSLVSAERTEATEDLQAAQVTAAGGAFQRSGTAGTRRKA